MRQKLLVSLPMHIGYRSRYTKTSYTLVYMSQPSYLTKFAVRLFPVCQIQVRHFPIRQITVFHHPVLQFPPLQLRLSFSSPANSAILA